MRILERNVYVGPSLYAHFPVIRCCSTSGPLEEWPTARLGPAYVDALVAALPGLQEHGCSYGEPGGFIRRMREDEGTWLGHVLEHVAIELQNVAGEDVTFGKTRSVDGRPGVYTVVYEYTQRDQGIEAGDLAMQAAVFAAARRHPPHRRACPATGPGPSARRLHPLRAAPRAGAEHGVAGEGGGGTQHPLAAAERASLIQLGQGKYQQRIQATVTGRTSTSPWSWRRTRKRPTRSWPTAACRCRARNWCAAPNAPCAPPNAWVIRWSPSPTTATTGAASAST
jgi:cyanophycin synthetase